MELREIIKLLTKNKAEILLITLMGLIAGTVIYMLPAKYVSSGAFYIKRSTDTNSTFFTYEGYYAQQTALSYANTVAALLESIDLRSKSMAELGISVDEFSLRKYQKLISVKKVGPQLISLSVKGKTYDEARNFWEALSNSLIQTTSEINSNGDPNLSISKINSEPVVKQEYKSLWLNLSVGFGLGLVSGLLFISLKEYLKK